MESAKDGQQRVKRSPLRSEEGAVMVLFALFVSALLIVFMMVVYDLGILVSLSREAQSLADLAASYGARQVDKSLGPQGMVGFSSDLKERVEDYLYKQLEVRYGENSDRYKVRDLVIECSPPPGTFESLEEFLASPQSFQVRVSFELWADKSLLVVPEESGQHVKAESSAFLSLGEVSS